MSLSRPDEGLFPISVVTELTGVGAHTFADTSVLGCCIRPARTGGRYGSNDLAVVRRAATLSAEGVNLAGIRRILPVGPELASLRAQIDALRDPGVAAGAGLGE